MEAFLLCLAILAIFAVPFALAMLLTKSAGLPGWLMTAVPAGALTGYWFHMADTAPGWDGLGYAILLIFGSAPAVAGIVIGGLVGKYKRDTA